MAGTSFQETRDSIGSEPESFPIGLKFFRDLKAYQTLKTSKINIAGGAIYGHPSYGMYGTAKYTDESTAGFILGHQTWGVLGTSLLGTYTSVPEVFSVTNQNNIFYELLDTTDFIDTSESTGTHGTSNYTLQDGEVLQSEIIAKNNKLFTKAIITLTGTNVTDAAIYISANGGTSWQSIQNGVQTVLLNPTTAGIKYKIINTLEAGIVFPITFPAQFPNPEDIILTKINVRYS